MRALQMTSEPEHLKLRNSRPPFVTQYEKDLMAWQRRHRMVQAILGIFLAAVVGFTIHLLPLVR